MQKFFEGFKAYTQDEERALHNQTTFRILDFDKDGFLNVINLCHLLQNIPHNTRLGLELYNILQYFYKKSLLKKPTQPQVTIDRDTYMKVCASKPSLTEEIRAFFCGVTCRKIETHTKKSTSATSAAGAMPVSYKLPGDSDEDPAPDS